ncbi:hypothetical protein EYF80_006193 [Liparis tanakae]|uniref:Uncharacterized protein n=1 Tax=Liparis tanakae TaxID=230148 RepID=A0A4Z2J018_9TELE|nr:hypothetical protein EYF80_006193 [Liparis tanakae]
MRCDGMTFINPETQRTTELLCFESNRRPQTEERMLIESLLAVQQSSAWHHAQLNDTLLSTPRCRLDRVTQSVDTALKTLHDI